MNLTQLLKFNSDIFYENFQLDFHIYKVCISYTYREL